jgi:hypothetical protein
MLLLNAYCGQLRYFTTARISILWLYSSQMNPQPALHQCSDCKQLKSSPEFSASQWKKTSGTGTCRSCQPPPNSDVQSVGSQYSQPQSAKSVTSKPRITSKMISSQQSAQFISPPQIQVFQPQLVRPPFLIQQDYFQDLTSELTNLRSENAKLLSEKSELMSKVIDLGLSEARVMKKLHDDEQKIHELEVELKRSNDEMVLLRAENLVLRKENVQLREEIQRLTDKVSEQSLIINKLEKSYKLENRIAIRVMVSDAKKKMKDSVTFSNNEKKILFNKAFTDPLNETAHIVAPSRIKLAIEEEEFGRRNLLLKVFKKTYPDYQEPEEMVDDDFTEMDDEVDTSL